MMLKIGHPKSTLHLKNPMGFARTFTIVYCSEISIELTNKLARLEK